MTKKRVTVDFDEESYYLDGEYWESWDNYGEEIADKINILLNGLNEEKEILVDVIKKADDLISRFGSNELKHQWKKAVTIKYR